MPNIPLPKGAAIDLYAAASITVGVKIQTSNLTSNDVRLSTSEAGLVNDHIPLGPREQAVNDSGDTGAFALSVGGGGVNVRAV